MKLFIFAKQIENYKDLKNAIAAVDSDSVIMRFHEQKKLFKKLEQGLPDVLFVEVNDIEAFTLLEKIMQKYPRLNSVIYSPEKQFALEAFSLNVSGYMYKKPTPEKMREQFSNLRYPVTGREGDYV